MYMTNAQFKVIEDALCAVNPDTLDEDTQAKIAQALETLYQIDQRKQERAKASAKQIAERRKLDPTYAHTNAYARERMIAEQYKKLDKEAIVINGRQKTYRYIYSRNGKLYTRIFGKFYEVVKRGDVYTPTEDIL